jgi:septum formation protein
LEEAREKLLSLRGKAHQLISAVVIYEQGRPVWRHIGRTQLVMRDFSDDFLTEYLQQNGKDILNSVGYYKIESAGAQLFTHIQGDYFTILGIPLLEVLGYLRNRGVLLV